MRDNDQKQREVKQQKGSSPLGAVVTGAVVGAGVVVAAQAALKNRKKLQEVVDMAKDKAGEYANTLKDKVMSDRSLAGHEEES